MAYLVTFGLPLALVLLAFVNYPEPEFPDDVLAMKRTGSYFNFASAGKNLRIFYRDLQGHGPASRNLFLMHGFPVSSFDWNLVLPGLQEDFGRLVVPEQLGYGLSDKPWPHNYTIMEQADIMEKLLKEFGVADAHFLCHDTGLTVCLELLARFNARSARNETQNGVFIHSFAFANAGLFTALTTPILMQQLATLPVIGQLLGNMVPRFLMERSLGRAFGPHTKPSRAHLNSAVSLIRHQRGGLALIGVISYIEQRAVHEDRWIGAMVDASARLPIHYMYGPADPVNKEPTFQHFKKVVSKATTDRFPEHIGHWPMQEDPDSFLKFYKSFLSSVTR